MKKIWARILGVFIIVYVGTMFLGLGHMASITSVLLFSIVFLFVNALLKPILLLLSLPITLLTLGLFSLVVNTWVVLITDSLVGGIRIYGFSSGFILALAISALHLFFIKPMDKEK